MTDLAGIKVSRAEVHSPIAVAEMIGDMNVLQRVEVTIGPVKSAELAAAEDGFRCLRVSHLEKYAAYRKMRFSKRGRPRREADWVEALVKDIIPDADESVIQAALQARSKKFYDEAGSLLADDSNLEVIENGLDQDDLAEIKKTAKTLQAERSQREGGNKAGAQAKKTDQKNDKPGSGADESRGWKLREFPSGDEDFSLEEAQALLPRVPGCGLTKDVKRFSRWSAKYPRPVPPCNFCKSWGPMTGETVRSSLRVVMRQIWTWHHHETGEACPISWD